MGRNTYIPSPPLAEGDVRARCEQLNDLAYWLRTSAHDHYAAYQIETIRDQLFARYRERADGGAE